MSETTIRLLQRIIRHLLGITRTLEEWMQAEAAAAKEKTAKR